MVWQAPPIAPGRSALPDPTATLVCEAESRARLSGVFEADADAGMHRRETRVTGRRRGGWPRGERDGCNRGRSNELDGRGLHAVPGWDLLRC